MGVGTDGSNEADCSLVAVYHSLVPSVLFKCSATVCTASPTAAICSDLIAHIVPLKKAKQTDAHK